VHGPGKMKLFEVKDILKAKVTYGAEKLDMVVQAGAGGDLMSDILRGSKEGVLVLSGLNNIQLIRTAVIAGVSALVLVRGKEPDEEMKKQAAEHGLSPPLLRCLRPVGGCSGPASGVLTRRKPFDP